MSWLRFRCSPLSDGQRSSSCRRWWAEVWRSRPCPMQEISSGARWPKGIEVEYLDDEFRWCGCISHFDFNKIKHISTRWTHWRPWIDHYIPALHIYISITIISYQNFWKTRLRPIIPKKNIKDWIYSFPKDKHTWVFISSSVMRASSQSFSSWIFCLRRISISDWSLWTVVLYSSISRRIASHSCSNFLWCSCEREGGG